MADWWLRENPKFKTLEHGGDWLTDFHGHLKEEDLHPFDWKHLKELTAFHEEKEGGMQDDNQFVQGSSTQVN